MKQGLDTAGSTTVNTEAGAIALNIQDAMEPTHRHELHSTPGALRGLTALTINTRQAQRLFLGRPAKVQNGQQVRPGVIGVRRFATLVRQVIVGARADDPYADQCLIQLDHEFDSATQTLVELRSRIEQELNIRAAIDITVAVSIEPVSFPLRFGNQYAYRAAYLVADYDQVAAAALSAHHAALLARLECEQLINRGQRLVRRVFNVPCRYRFSGASRKDVAQMNARGVAALDKYGAVPEAILTRTLIPDYGAVRLSDGSAIIDPAGCATIDEDTTT